MKESDFNRECVQIQTDQIWGNYCRSFFFFFRFESNFKNHICLKHVKFPGELRVQSHR